MKPEDKDCEHGSRYQTIGMSAKKGERFLLLLCQKRKCSPNIFPITIGER